MKRQKILFFTGLFLIFITLLGFPLWFKNIFTILVGLFLCAFSYTAHGAIALWKRKRTVASTRPEIHAEIHVHTGTSSKTTNDIIS